MENETADAFSVVEEAAVSAASETVGKVTSSLITFLKTIFTWQNLFKTVGVILILIIFWIVFNLIKKGLNRFMEGKKTSAHYKQLVMRTVHYAFYIISILYVLSAFGVKLKALWGAAGIAGVAIGFAAQTTVSNLISGLFVLGEKTMKIGDFILCGGVSGTVESVGLLSVKVKTLDGQMIRIPNSSIINSNFQNNNYFETRRMCFESSIAYEADMDKALEVMKSVPSKCPTVLQDPAPAVWFDGLADSGINITLAVWFKASDLVQTKNDVYRNIVKMCNEAGIEIPYNKLDVNLKK